MSIYFLDASALAKRYLVEIGTNWIRDICNPAQAHSIIASEITRVEVAAAIAARFRDQSITETERFAAYGLLTQHIAFEYQMVPVERTILDRAANLTQVRRLRGYDAVQLGAALVVAASYQRAGFPALIFVTADRDLLAAGTAEGLTVEDPNRYP